ncbi:MAG TPA: hypothetical protein PK127_10565 [Clostridiales bacterium]|nr:hypothetical protein [Clostridiales bacterium]HPV02902.1 hypothetical protein [Clostridiales bacterium]
MSAEILFEKDMLYPTENSIEPGSIHIRILSPDNRSRLPVLIEPKSNHPPIKYIDSIIRLMQTDIFDRIFVDIKKNVEIYIAKHNADGDRGDTTYIRVYYRDGELVEEEAESIIKETKP